MSLLRWQVQKVGLGKYTRCLQSGIFAIFILSVLIANNLPKVLLYHLFQAWINLGLGVVLI